jgi:hypothetical protein
MAYCEWQIVSGATPHANVGVIENLMPVDASRLPVIRYGITMRELKNLVFRAALFDRKPALCI